MKVLLAEDHKMVRQGTRLYLESMGIEVVGEATNGREAIELAGRLQPELVVMDIHLPELTGVEATRRIRHDYPDIRILVTMNPPMFTPCWMPVLTDLFLKQQNYPSCLRR